jgi:hypothetical protein
MTHMQLIGLIIGGIATLSGIMVLRKSQLVLTGMAAFPRSKYPAWILSAINMIWAGKLCTEMYLGWFDLYKWVFYVVCGFGIFALIRYLDELLAPRMLGGFLLLVAAPILKTARFFPTPMDPSPWRLILSLLCYSWIILGIYLLCCPWGFRKLTDQWLKVDPTLKIGGSIKLTFGIAFLIVSALFYGK